MSSSVERNNPPPRRKSCEACRAAKRRCDLALPTCFRCTRRRVACVYPGLPAPDLVPELLALLGQPEALESPCVAQFTIDTPPIFEPVLLETHTQEPMRPPLLTHVRTRPGLDLPDLIASRFQYAIDTLRDTPRRMVVENQTPWSHRELYADGMPKVMQDAYACCALYITKNSINAAMITSHILSRHHELVLSALPTSPSDLLAHTHALLLYRLMLVFDPDLSDAISGSTFHALSMSALESAAALLFSSTHFPPESETDSAFESRTSLLPSTLEQTMHFWKLWVFEESARRTVLFTFYCLQIVRLVCGDKMMECDGKLGLIHSWYFSAHLWNAPSALDFAIAWAEKEHFIVRNVNFTRVLREAQPSDVDCLGKMLLETSQGVDRMREWFFARGAIL